MSDEEVLEPEPDEPDDEAIDSEPSFLAEARSILISAVGVTFQRFVVIDDEVELASWRRFRRTIITGAVLYILIYHGLDLAFRLHVDSALNSSLGTSPSLSLTLRWGADGRQILLFFIWDMITIMPIALMVGFSATYFLEKLLSQDERSSDLVILAQPMALVWMQRLVFAGIFISLSDIFWRWSDVALYLAPRVSGALDQSAITSLSQGEAVLNVYPITDNPLLFGGDTAQWLGVFTAAIGIGLIIYSYFLFKRTLTRLYPDLRGYELWIALGILAIHFEILFYVATRGVTESPLGGLYWRIAQYLINL